MNVKIESSKTMRRTFGLGSQINRLADINRSRLQNDIVGKPNRTDKTEQHMI